MSQQGGKPFSHIVVFLIPGVVLPPNSAAAIFLMNPAPPGQPMPEGKFLGGIYPGKDSAIFNLGGLTNKPVDMDEMIDDGELGYRMTQVVIGISIENYDSVLLRIGERAVPNVGINPAPYTPAPLSATSRPAAPLPPASPRGRLSTPVLAHRVIKNVSNFLAGFSGTAGVMEVPLKSFEDWARRFVRRVEVDPGFLESEEVSDN